MSTAEKFETGLQVTSESVELRNQYIGLDLTSHLPERDGLNTILSAAGVMGTAVLDIEAGRQRFAIVDVSEAPSFATQNGMREYQPFLPNVTVGDKSPREIEIEEASPYILVHLAEDGATTARAIRLGEPILLGRLAHKIDPKSDRFDYADDGQLADRQLNIILGDDGKTLQIEDLDSDRGTLVRYSPEARQRFEPDYNNALLMEADELWAEKGNGGRTQDPDYIKNHQILRAEIVNAFRNGDLYKSPQAFMRFLQAAHHFLASTGDYNRLNTVISISSGDYGEFRKGGRQSNGRIGKARFVATVAEYYNDSYANRFAPGIPNTETTSYVMLPGINEENLPYDVVRYDEGGDIKSMENDGHNERGYQYAYPPASAVPEYMEQITGLGKQIEGAMKRGDSDADNILDLIARQYQYGAIIRPFVQINNSLSMQILNTQIKLLGHDGMTHGNMDHIAQRLQPDAFAHYFIDRVRGIVE